MSGGEVIKEDGKWHAVEKLDDKVRLLVTKYNLGEIIVCDDGSEFVAWKKYSYAYLLNSVLDNPDCENIIARNVP